MKTLIQGGFVVGFDGEQHVIYENGCVAYEKEFIIFIGFPDDPQCPKCDSRLDAPESIISPGFINLHCIANIDLQPNYLDTNTQINRAKKWFNSNTNIMSRKEY